MKPNESTVSGYRRFECNSNRNKGGEKNQSASTEHAGTKTHTRWLASPPLPPSYIYIYRANKSVVSAHERDTIESNRHFVRS